MIRIIRDFCTAVTFFTRIPLHRWADYSESSMNKSTVYYPLIGWIVGAVAAFVFWATNCFIPVFPAIVVSTIATVWLTGAFHEDGFADVCDGFGGGWKKDRILSIMKDSRVGAYGAIGLMMILLCKISMLVEISSALIPITLLAGHTMSRMVSINTMMVLKYVRADDDSGKSNSIARKLSVPVFIWVLIAGVAPMVFLGDWKYLVVIFPQIIVFVLMNRWFNKWIGGYTGDCLGALQQVSEVVFYFSVLIIERNCL